MSWIELHATVFTHRKTIAAARELTRGDAERLVGHLGRLWCWAVDHAQDGDLSYLTPQQIAQAAGWRGRATRFIDVLRSIGFVDADGHLHDWDDYAGRLIDKRRADAARKKAERGERRRVSAGLSIGASPGTSDGQSDGQALGHPHAPYLTVPNHTEAGVRSASPAIAVEAAVSRPFSESPTGAQRERAAVPHADGTLGERVARIVEAAADPWREVLRVLSAELPASSFVVWFGGTSLELHDGVGTIVAPNDFARDKLAEKYRRRISSALEGVVGRPVDVKVRTAA